MTDHDRKGANAEQSDRNELGSDTKAPESPPSTATNTEKADGRELPPQVRRVRNRQGKRSRRFLGKPVTIEFRDSSRVPATLLDESPSGMAVDVADGSLFRAGQRLSVRRSGQRTTAIVRYVESVADTCRVGLKLSLA